MKRVIILVCFMMPFIVYSQQHMSFYYGVNNMYGINFMHEINNFGIVGSLSMGYETINYKYAESNSGVYAIGYPGNVYNGDNSVGYKNSFYECSIGYMYVLRKYNYEDNDIIHFYQTFGIGYSINVEQEFLGVHDNLNVLSDYYLEGESFTNSHRYINSSFGILYSWDGANILLGYNCVPSKFVVGVGINFNNNSLYRESHVYNKPSIGKVCRKVVKGMLWLIDK